MDSINSWADNIVQSNKPTSRLDPALRAYVELSDQLKGTPRFILDANATRTAVELTLGRPKILIEAMQHLIIPYRRLWVEWNDGDRQKLRDRFSEPDGYSELRPMPGRVGFFLETDKTGRRGSASWAWSAPGSVIPNVGVIQPHYDLDHTFDLHPDRYYGLIKGNLAMMWQNNPIQLSALLDIWRTCEHRPVSWAEQFWSMLPNRELAKALSYSDVVGDYITIWVVMLMLTSSREVIRYQPVSMAKLNKHRIKRGDTPLLDHTNITLHLTPQHQRPIVRSHLGYSRKSPRVHMVSSYLARRGNKHWLVYPYMRGSGDAIHRVVNVKG
jgi:hypothetical protein